MRLLADARRKRIAEERTWQLAVAVLPLQEKPQEYFDELMASLESQGGGSNGSGGGWQPSKKYPLLHEITEVQAKVMRIPIRYVKVTEDGAT